MFTEYQGPSRTSPGILPQDRRAENYRTLDAQLIVPPRALVFVVDNLAAHRAALNIPIAPIAIIAMLSTAIRPIVIIASPPNASNKGRVPHFRQAGVQKKTSGIPASIRIAYTRNACDPGTLIPSGASNSTRHAGHFGRHAKISEENDDDINGSAGVRFTIHRSYAESGEFALVCLD